MKHRRSIGGLALLAAGVAYAAVELARAPRWTVDDAFIVARYADNLVRHGLFAFDLEGPRVEGISSPLFALVATVAVALGRSPIGAMTAIGCASLLASGPLVYALARAHRAPPGVAGLLACVWLAIPEHVTHAISGLETEAFLAVEIACALALARGWRAPRGRAPGTLVGLSLLAALLRPEGIAVAAVVLAVATWRLARVGRARSFTRAIGLGFALPLALGLAARVAYFHALLPNTYWAKQRGPATLRVAGEIASLADDYLVVLALAAVCAIVLARAIGVGARRIGSRAVASAIAASALLVVFAMAYRHADVMNYSRRFAMHALPWALVLVVLVVAHGASRFARLGRRSRLGAIAGASLAAATLLLGGLVWLPRVAFVRKTERETMTEHILLRRETYEPVVALLERLPRTTRLAVYPDAGYLPWRTGLHTIDFGRLNDRYLAREARTDDDVVRYFFEVAPDVVVFSHYGEGRLWNGAATRIVADPRFAAWQLAGDFRAANGWGLTVHARR